MLARQTEKEFKSSGAVQKSLQKKQSDASLRLANLLKLKISPENQDNDLLSNAEFKKQKNEIVTEKAAFQEEMDKLNKRQVNLIDLTMRTFNFCKIAKEKFQSGTDEDKRLILACVGSNLIIKDKKLFIKARKVFQVIENWECSDRGHPRGVEPRESREKDGISSQMIDKYLVWQGLLQEVRTALQEKADFIIPDFPASTSSS
jgi:hypothetical protein